MEDYINESVETQDVAEPEVDVEESAETQEVAEPETEATPVEESGKTAQDSAFAEQRRKIQELEKKNAELESNNKSMFDALGKYFNGDTAEELSINANAYAEGRDADEYRAEWEHNKEFESLQKENEELRDQLLNAQVEQLMRDGLREIKEIDPEVKSLDDLGDNFAKFVGAGLSTKEAYFASKAMEAKTKVNAPSPIGKVSDTQVERDYYTSEELDHLTDDEMEENWDKVMRSMNRL